SIGPQMGRGTVENLQAKARDLLDLNPQEQEAADRMFANYFATVDHLVEASVYETNQAPELQLPIGTESKIFVMQPVGSGISNLVEELYSNLAATLGRERLALLNPNEADMARGEQVRVLGYMSYAPNQPKEGAVNIIAREGAEPMVSFTGENGTGTGAMPLKFFRPT